MQQKWQVACVSKALHSLPNTVLNVEKVVRVRDTH